MDLSGHSADARDSRGTRWSVTINCKSVSRSTAEECIDRARQLGWRVYGQIERGDSGTEHFQLAVSTPQVRFSAVKKVFPTAHIELAKNWSALMSYCQKDDTKVEDIKQVSSTYVPWSQLRQMFVEWLVEDEFRIHTTDPERRLQVWDQFIGHLIEEGNEVDLMGMNANYRACISRYWRHYINRYTQTERQTDIQELTIPSLI